MADSHDNISVNTASEAYTNKEKINEEEIQSDADKLSRDWKARLVHLSDAQLTESPDILVAILFLILTDNGFIPTYNQHLQDERTSCELYYKLPSDWKTIALSSSYCLKFTLPECFDFRCCFTAMVLGDLILMTIVCSYPDTANSLSLNVSDFIVRQSNTFHITKSNKLHYMLRDNIVTWSRSAAFSYRGIPSASLTGLPKEIFEYVLVLCGPIATCKLMCTSRLLKMLTRDQLVWHTFYLQDFDNFISNSVDDDSHDWYERYRDAFLAKAHIRRKSCIWKIQRPSVNRTLIQF